MAEYRVHVSAVASFSVLVEAEDPDEAIDKAYEDIPGICAQCSGWRQSWALDLGESWETDAVDDAEGKEVWATDETWRRAREIDDARALAAEVTRLAGLVEAVGVGKDGGFVDGIRTAVDLLLHRASELRGEAHS